MPTFHDPLADADEASEALRGLAHATRSFDDPAQTYRVFGDLLAGVRSLEQILDQLAAAHLTHRGRAHDDNGDPLAGTRAALAAAEELHQSRGLLEQAEARLNNAFNHSGRIAWHPEPAQPEPDTASASVRRWVRVMFLRGSEAAEVLDLIDAEGTDAAVEQLKCSDYGEETTQAALENGYVFDEPPTSALDRLVTDQSGYALTYNHSAEYASLLRQHSIPSPDALDEPGEESPQQAVSGPRASQRSAGARREPDAFWLDHPSVTTAKQNRGLSR